MRIRDPWRLGVMCVGIGLIAGLGIPAHATAANAAPNQIKLTWALAEWPDNVPSVYQKLAQIFEAQHPNIKIEVVNYAHWMDQLPVNLAAGTAPDVAKGWGPLWRAFVDQGYFLALNPYLDEAQYSLKPFISGQLKAWTRDGKLYSLPVYAGTQAMVINRTAWDKAGLKFTTDMDWDTWLSYSQKLTMKNPDGSVRRWGTAAPTAFVDLATGVLPANGGRVMPDNEMAGSKLLIDESPALEGIRFVHSLIWKYHVAPSAPEVGSTGFAPYELFPKGRIAMIPWGGLWDMHFWVPTDFEISIIEPPRGKAGRSTMVTTDGYAVLKTTQHPKEAAEFVMFLASKEASTILATDPVRGLQPARADVLETWFAANPLTKAKGTDVRLVAKTYAYARPEPYFVNMDVIDRRLTPVLQQIFDSGTLDPDTGIKGVVPAINAELARSLKH